MIFLHILQIFGMENMSARRFSSIHKIDKVIAPGRERFPARAQHSGSVTHNRALCRHLYFG